MTIAVAAPVWGFLTRDKGEPIKDFVRLWMPELPRDVLQCTLVVTTSCEETTHLIINVEAAKLSSTELKAIVNLVEIERP